MTTWQVFYFSVGLISLFLGVIGIFVPLLPTTPFLLLAAWSFARSSPRFHFWLVTHPKLGPIIQLWEEKRAIPLGAKLVALPMIAVSLVFVWIWVPLFLVQVGLTVMLISVSLFIASRPNQ